MDFLELGNKEPNRDDYTNSTPNSRPSHESMTDIEVGYKLKYKKALCQYKYLFNGLYKSINSYGSN